MWYFKSPEIAFGADALARLDQCQGKRAFIVTDEGIEALGFLKIVQDKFAEIGMQSASFTGVLPDPGLDVVQRCAEAMRAFEPDWVVGLGGGSSMDTAKAAWFLYERPDVDLAAVTPFEQFGLRSKARLITIPTTAGSGAEVTAAAVIKDAADFRKMEVASYELIPDLAIVDPRFSAQMPAELTADTGIDALTHAVEGYSSTFANDFSDALCLQALRMIFDYLPQAVLDGDSLAREKMANAATIAALGLGNSHIALAHALGHSAGGAFSLAHGKVTGMLLPYTIEFTANGGAGRYTGLAQVLGLPVDDPLQTAYRLADEIRRLLQMVGLPGNFAQAGITPADFESGLDALCARAEMDSALATCRRFPYRQDLERLFIYAYQGKRVDF